ncbi:radical SAM protein [Myxococcota bacterium]
MGNQPVKRYIDEVARDLFAPLLLSPPGPGWKLVGWDAEQGLCLTFQRDATVILVEFEDRDEQRDCYARTGRFNVCARRQFETGAPLTKEDRQLVDSVVAVVREREDRLPDVDRPSTGRRRAVREIRVDRVLIPEGRNHYYINPYVGCMIGCPFCYVIERADLSRRLEGLPQLPWGRYLDVKVNAAEVLRREVGSHPPGIVRFSPILTDPYQAIERKYRITRQCLEVLLEAGFSVMVLTRAARIVEDLDLLRSFPRAVVGFSVPTDDDAFRRIFEPGADPVEERIRALQTFHAAGVPTVAVVQPILPMDPQRLVSLLAPIVRAVRIDRMYSMHLVRQLYEEHDLQHAATDAFFEKHEQELREGFTAAGVVVDEMDELHSLMELLFSSPGR